VAVVLIIEDEPAVRAGIARRLRSKGYETLEAPEGRAALELYKRHHPDVVLTDILMPEQEGIETITELRGIDPEVKIIAMSGGGDFGRLDLLDFALKLGAKAVLRKPFATPELLRCIEELVDTRS
jgi:CheY-like chemotaxis protein